VNSRRSFTICNSASGSLGFARAHLAEEAFPQQSLVNNVESLDLWFIEPVRHRAGRSRLLNARADASEGKLATWAEGYLFSKPLPAWHRVVPAVQGRSPLIVGANKRRTTIQAAISARRRLSGKGSIAHCRIFESGLSVAILLTSPVEIRRWLLSPSSDFLDQFSKRQLTKYTG
jgi:hypothetical protein